MGEKLWRIIMTTMRDKDGNNCGKKRYLAQNHTNTFRQTTNLGENDT